MDNPLPPSDPQPLTTSPMSPTESNVDLWGRLRLGLLVVGILLLTVIGRMCGQKKVTDNIPGQAVKIETKGSHVNIKTNNGSSSISQRERNAVDSGKYIPPEGNLTITPKDPTKSIDDLVKIHYQEIGFVFEPGIEFSSNVYHSYGLDAKLFYAYRFGTGVGLVGGSNVQTIISPDVFISYRLDQLHLKNTEAIVTYIPTGKIPFGVGLRINF